MIQDESSIVREATGSLFMNRKIISVAWNILILTAVIVKDLFYI